MTPVPAGGPGWESWDWSWEGVLGEVLDGIGYYMTYGQAERPDICQSERLLPMGLAEGARLKRDIATDAVLTLDDVELPAGRMCDQLRAEQDAMFDFSGDQKTGAVG